MAKHYDVGVIGSGPAGYAAAIRLSQLNKSVCVIDVGEERLGGVCLNEGCIPVKSLIHSAGVYSAIKRAKDFGIEAEAKQPDIKKMLACSEEAAVKLRSGLKSLFKKYGIEFIAGAAGFDSHGRLIAKSKGASMQIEADKIIIATGSSPSIPSCAKIVGKRILTAGEVLKLDKMPKTILIAGAGAIGIEFCSFFASLGTRVTLVELMPNLLPFEDEEISKALLGIFKKRGVDVSLNTRLKDLKEKSGSCEAILETPGGEKKMEPDFVLLAMGRNPNTSGIGLEGIGVRLDEGFVLTDGSMKTNIENIYAAGDIVKSPMYAHTAYKEGIIAAEHIAGVKTEPINYEDVPNAVFSEPQIASVGLTESKALEKGCEIAVSKRFFKTNGMAVASGSDEGFIKIIAERRTKKILGVHIIGSGAAEIIHEFVVAKTAGLKIDDIAKAVHAHPTFSEIAQDAAKAVFGKAIHG